jgi:hypothetical protein
VPEIEKPSNIKELTQVPRGKNKIYFKNKKKKKKKNFKKLREYAKLKIYFQIIKLIFRFE